MAASLDIRLGADPPLPEFGDGVGRRETPCGPRELFCALFVELERSVHFLQPAFDLTRSLLSPTSAAFDPNLERALASDDGLPALGFVQSLEQAAGHVPAAALDGSHASSWVARLVRELGPLGLSDGAWLRGFVQVNMVENEVGMRMLRQLMLRMGDPGSGEGHAARFSALLASLGIPPESITRWEWAESAPCADISYEHALLGLCLGFFPSSFSLETLGFNLWMACVGPCPLLDELAPALRQRGADLRYVERYPRGPLTDLARQAVLHALAESDTSLRRTRIARGLVAARSSYLRWQQAMLGRNVPFSPRDFVLEGIRRKARFAIEHHRDVRVAKSNVADLLAQGGDAHELLLDKLAASALVKRGDPDHSRLICHSITIDGPMFDAFTASEKLDLREWIERLGPARQARPVRPDPIPLAGLYTPPRDPDDLERFAFERYGELDNRDLYYCFANADLHPTIILFGRMFVSEALEQLYQALDGDPRLGSMDPPPYSERYAAQMVAEQHEKNVRSRSRIDPEDEASPGSGGPTNPIAAIFDGCWLQGFADVRRSGLEEYGWLFRIYASEHGDGDLAWNHCQIFRRAFEEAGPDVMLPKTDRRFYDLFEIGHASLATLAISMNTQRFLPEILGLNLAIEATGVGGMYLDQWKNAELNGAPWKALAHRLHNSIDNHADGHTKWSLAAVQAFMRRVREVAPDDVEQQWRRIWRPWRCQDILTHGSEAERAALAELLDVTSLAPT